MEAGAAPQFHVDASAFPVVTVQLPGVWGDDQQVQSKMAQIQTLHRRGLPFCLVFLPQGAAVPNSRQRHLIAESMKESESIGAGLLQGMAVVSTSVVARGVFTALGWFAPQKFPIRLFPTHEEARAWARERTRPG
jgi:hypothetical protein